MFKQDQLPTWLQPPWARLSTLEAPPAALLLVAPGSQDADGLATLLSQFWLCEAKMQPCQQSCRSCKEWQAGVHPDFFVVEPPPDKRETGIDQIRAATQWSGQTPRGQRRILLVRRAERLNNAAANAFLKTLEEPSASLSIIVATRRLNALPATIRSRCMQITLRAPSPEACRQWLEQQHCARNNIDAAAVLNPGDVLAALNLNEDEEECAQRAQAAWKLAWEQGDSLGAAQQLDNDHWQRALVGLQNTVVLLSREHGASAFDAVWTALLLLRKSERIAFNRLLLLEELFMLVRRAKLTLERDQHR